MTGHLSVPRVDPTGDPATISHPVVTGLLREELGYDGVVVTDSLWMAGVRSSFSDDDIAVRAIVAGSDLLLTPPDLRSAHGAILRAIDEGVLTEARIDESVRRILVLKQRRGLVEGVVPATPPLEGVVGTPEHRARADQLAVDGATALDVDCSRFPLSRGQGVVVLSDGTGAGAELASELASLGVPVRSAALGSGAAAMAGSWDVAVVVTDEAGPGGMHQRAVGVLGAAGITTFVVSTGAPYDAGVVDPSGGYLAVYDAGRTAMRAAAAVLTGRAQAGGRLPVAVPGRGGPDYPIGARAEPCRPPT